MSDELTARLRDRVPGRWCQKMAIELYGHRVDVLPIDAGSEARSFEQGGATTHEGVEDMRADEVMVWLSVIRPERVDRRFVIAGRGKKGGTDKGWRSSCEPAVRLVGRVWGSSICGD
ncbi:hypothetical protein [Kocuria tytonicola]|uniref:hypothetical protein n=1 Tax=Kocuria tytonicola TaxID=2055946 RepID=UPI000F528A89|nr:hypothetical protein [Kocuria tytonicola]